MRRDILILAFVWCSETFEPVLSDVGVTVLSERHMYPSTGSETCDLRLDRERTLLQTEPSMMGVKVFVTNHTIPPHQVSR